ncbi:acyltransferase family protein [Streptomyces pseudogriseolus]|uniref:acyltransferase family protein n=1 Tax=Streptomyces pseudogriseolus TaxID=36817 RepID=UPI003FA291CE
MTHGHPTGAGPVPNPAGPYPPPYGTHTGVAPGPAHAFPRQQTTEPAPVPSPEPADPPAAPKKPGRDRYLDLLRSVALVRVVVYHLFGWAWLSIVFPSMGVMFALAGSLMARSLKRGAWSVIRGRLRRLLPPMWLFGGVALALLFLSGWNPGDDPDQGGRSWGLVKLFHYLVPIGAPPYPFEAGDLGVLTGGTWADDAVGPLWYLRAYLWFVLASPLLLWAFRRAPWPTLLAPLGLTAVVGTGLVTIPGETGNAVTDFAVYGSCWVLGFAHQDGMLKQVPRYISVSGAAFVMAFGLWWASGHLGDEGWDLNNIPLAQAAWSFGFVVILLQYSPSWQELPGRLANWDKLVTLSNNRAVTIYLWHNLLIALTFPIVDLLYELPFMQSERGVEALNSTYELWAFAFVWPLIGLVILSTGWIEDLAAKRRPRLWPNGTKRKHPEPAGRGRRH